MLKAELIKSFNTLGIPDMEPVQELHQLKGDFINMEYQLPGGQLAKFWDDDKMYYGAQMGKENSNRCYGLAADDKHLMVCEYGDGGTAAEIIVFKKL